MKNSTLKEQYVQIHSIHKSANDLLYWTLYYPLRPQEKSWQSSEVTQLMPNVTSL